MVISIAIQNIPAKVWTDYFVAFNLHPHHRMTFHDWIKNISPLFEQVQTYFSKQMAWHLFGKICLYLFEER